MATRVVGLSGTAGSGKSEASFFMTEALGFTLVKFAGPLKAMLRAYYREVGLTEAEIERRIEGDLKEVPDAHLNGRTPRHAMETLGTEWGRVCMGQDFWINAWGWAVAGEPGPVVTDDCRFDNEADAIHSLGGEVIRLTPKVSRRKKSNHVAEKGLSPYRVDHEIANDGTVAELRAKVAGVINQSLIETFAPLKEYL
ncbi:MAG: deoxynucleotide monophosphate kinase [Pararhizobium sp.]